MITRRELLATTLWAGAIKLFHKQSPSNLDSSDLPQTPHQTLPIGLYHKQAEFLKIKTLEKGFAGGRCSGKSFIGAYDLIQRTRGGRSYMVIAPTHGVLQYATFQSLIDVATKANRLKSVSKLHPLKAQIHTEDGGVATVIGYSSQRADLLRGPNVSGVWIDEANYTNPSAYYFAAACLREKMQIGWLTLTFTPTTQDKNHWTHKLFYDLHGRRRLNRALVNAKTSDNIFIPKS